MLTDVRNSGVTLRSDRGKYRKMSVNCGKIPENYPSKLGKLRQKTARKCSKMSENCIKSHKPVKILKYTMKLPQKVEQLVSTIINRKIKT